MKCNTAIVRWQGEVGVEAIIDNPTVVGKLVSAPVGERQPEGRSTSGPTLFLLRLDRPPNVYRSRRVVEKRSSNADVTKSGSMTLPDSLGPGDQPSLALRKDAMGRTRWQVTITNHEGSQASIVVF